MSTIVIIALVMLAGITGGVAVSAGIYWGDRLGERLAIQRLMGKPLTAADEARIRQTLSDTYASLGQWTGLCGKCAREGLAK